LTVAVGELEHAKIAIFANPTYVDTTDDPTEPDQDAEYLNMRAGLIADGDSVTPFTGITASALSAALNGRDVLVIPELENAALVLAPDAAKVVRDFVGHGGTLVMNGQSGDNDTDFLNEVFGFSVNNGGSLVSGEDLAKQPWAAGTTFADDPATIDANDATYTLNASNLPANALNLYSLGSSVAAADLPFGVGQVVYLGYDWYDAKPNGAQDGGWLAVLKSAISETDGIIRGTAGPDSISTISAPPGQALASEYNDVIRGFGGPDSLSGGGGNDHIYGGRAADFLFGGPGFDHLYGGKGADYIEDEMDAARFFGGHGHDTFAFSLPDEPPPIVEDFLSGTDTILLDTNNFTALPNGDLAKAAFHNGSHATSPEDRIVYNHNGKLFYDPDGSGPLAAHHFATLKDHPLLKYSDIDVHNFG
jgi:Ca2+-binding RTX toxin-like protein